MIVRHFRGNFEQLKLKAALTMLKVGLKVEKKDGFVQ